jgi:hypothetical protein
MIRFILRVLGVSAASALLCVFCSCSRSGTDHTSFAAQVLGREFVVEIDGKGNFHPSGQVTIVKIGEHQLGIEKERLMLDGKECAKVQPKAQRFEVTYAKQTLTVTVDEAKVLSTPLVAEEAPASAAATEAAPAAGAKEAAPVEKAPGEEKK